MLVDEATWAAIRHDYETTNEPLRSMGARFIVGCTTILEHARRDGWAARPLRPTVIPRPKIIPRPTAVAPPASQVINAQALPAGDVTSPPRPKRACADAPEVRIARLFHIIDIQLDNLELLMMTGETLTVEDEARMTRSLNTIVSNLEKVTEAAAALAQAGGMAKGAKKKDAHLKAEQLRAEIAERLERLNAQWNAQAKPE